MLQTFRLQEILKLPQQVSYSFQPLAIKTLGPLNFSAVVFVSQLGCRLSESSRDPREIAFRFYVSFLYELLFPCNCLIRCPIIGYSLYCSNSSRRYCVVKHVCNASITKYRCILAGRRSCSKLILCTCCSIYSTVTKHAFGSVISLLPVKQAGLLSHTILFMCS